MSSTHHFSPHQKKQYFYFRGYVFFYYFFLALLMPFQPLYFVNVGIPIYGVFLNAGLATILSFFIGNLWSKHAHYGNRKKFLVLGNLAFSIAAILTIFTNSFGMMLIITFIQGISPNPDVMATVMVYELTESAENLVNLDDNERKYHQINGFARYRLYGSYGWAIILPLIGIILNNIPNQVQSGITFIISAIGFALIAFFFNILVDEPEGVPDKPLMAERNQPIPKEEFPEKRKETMIEAFRDLFSNKFFVLFMVMAFFFNASRNIAFQIQGLFFVGFTENYILWGLTFSLAALAEVPAMNLIAKYVRKWSWERMLVFAYLLTALRMILMYFLATILPSLALGYILQIMNGITLGIRLPTTTYGIHSVLSKKNRTLGQSFNSTVRMLGSLFANIMGSLFAYLLPESKMYIAIFIFSAVTAFLAGIGLLMICKINKIRC